MNPIWHKQRLSTLSSMMGTRLAGRELALGDDLPNSGVTCLAGRELVPGGDLH